MIKTNLKKNILKVKKKKMFTTKSVLDKNVNTLYQQRQ